MSNPPSCPQCNHGDFERLADPASPVTAAPNRTQRPPADEIITSASTMVLTPEQMKVYAERLARAKTARIERIGGRTDLPKSLELSDSKVVSFGKLGKAEMPIEGFCLGAAPRIRWHEDAYYLEKGGFLPAVTLNGEKVESAKLLSGLIFKVGNSQFRFINE